MSQHPSLLGSQKGKQHKSVFKRHEKLKHLMEKEKWDDEKSSIFALPKIKSIKFKVKKEKAAAPAAAEASAGTTAQAAPAATPGAAAAKPAAEKSAPAKDKKGK